MVLLEALYGSSDLAGRGDAVRGGQGGGDRGDVRDLVLDGGLADVGIVVLAELSDGGVDDQVDLAVLDAVGDVRPAL